MPRDPHMRLLTAVPDLPKDRLRGRNPPGRTVVFLKDRQGGLKTAREDFCLLRRTFHKKKTSTEDVYTEKSSLEDFSLPNEKSSREDFLFTINLVQGMLSPSMPYPDHLRCHQHEIALQEAMHKTY